MKKSSWNKSKPKKAKHDPWNAGPDDPVPWDCSFCGIKAYSPEKDMFQHWKTCEKAHQFFKSKGLIRGPIYGQ